MGAVFQIGLSCMDFIIIAAGVKLPSESLSGDGRFRSDSQSRGQTTTSEGPFDRRDDILGESAGEKDREVSGAGRDRPADGKGGPPSDYKIIPPADIEERHRSAHHKYDNGGDHDRKDESCFAFHLSEPLALRYCATFKIALPTPLLVSFPPRSYRLRGRPTCVRR
jgi:hypothetical protein